MKIYQAYMDAQQREFVSENAIPYDAEANNTPGGREYELFRQIYADTSSESNDEPWGLVSWKFEHKSPIGFDAFRNFCETAFDNGADCAFINPMIGNAALYANVWEQGIHCAHTGIEKVAYFLEDKMAIKFAMVCGVDTFAFCNYFVANDRFWKRYFAFIEKALALLDEETARNTEVGQIYSGSGQYERDGSASMRIFIIERLFSSFLLQQNELKTAAWKPSATDFEHKFGTHMGQMLWNFFRTKQRAVEADDLSVYKLWDKQRAKLLGDWHIHIVWNMDDPFSWTLSREYGEFIDTCNSMFNVPEAARSQLLQGIAT